MKQAPRFVFLRRRDIELAVGFVLAGTLVLDDPEDTMPNDAHDIVTNLSRMARAGRMPDNAVIYGWRGNGRPPNAIDVDDDAVMEAWAQDRLVIDVRIDNPRDDGCLKIDFPIGGDA